MEYQILISKINNITFKSAKEINSIDEFNQSCASLPGFNFFILTLGALIKFLMNLLYTLKISILNLIALFFLKFGLALFSLLINCLWGMTTYSLLMNLTKLEVLLFLSSHAINLPTLIFHNSKLTITLTLLVSPLKLTLQLSMLLLCIIIIKTLFPTLLICL